MGGLETAKISGSNYNCIHNIINRNDIVPRVAPQKMNFIRYGIDHYIPGTDAGTVAKGNDGNQYDNTFYNTSSTEYANVKSVYNGGHNITSTKYTIYGDIQTALRHFMTMLYGSPKAETDEFTKRLISIYKESTWTQLFDMAWNALRKWDDPGFKYKAHYVTKVLKWFEDKKCFDALKSLTAIEKNKLMTVDMPVILNLLLTYASNDYWKRSPQYGTNGLAQILTLVSNMNNIDMNHNPEVTLAWLRAQDSLY